LLISKQGTGISCPTIDNLLATYFSYFISIGFLPPPPNAPSNLQIDWKKIGEGVEAMTRTNRT
jgi:hypothetical protein